MLGSILLAFIAGVLTVLAPCVIPILPIILGSGTASKNWKKSIVIILSLSFSIFILTLLLIFLADFSAFKSDNLKLITVAVLFLFGLILIFPKYWDKVNVRFGFANKSDRVLNKFSQRTDILGHIFVGFSLGPVFNSCSPTFIVFILPLLEKDIPSGIVHLFFYLLGLVIVLSLVAFLGFRFTSKLKWAYNPNGVFRKILGVMFVLISIGIVFSIDKQIETYLLSNTDFYINLINFESSLQEVLR